MEVDYQTALLLQYKLEQEHRRKKEDTKSDHQLALELQEQFNHEGAIEKPANHLVYKAPATANTSKCLVDPSWEVIDPTPDVHTLFIAFDQKFFWKSLGSVTVTWSKRMTTCAGICSYQGRGGMCSITLSEPLLKLRPRKDLVETLLHEMIHAYLFVTNNNRDRDGHGPEFHKHMYRINAEAGTNITVYHDFHEEVRLYQQHWWRCDGPCQQRKPYFGMVRRATNRAPGPNDRWWAEHKAKCGGNFMKVKSPETAPKKSKTKDSSKTTKTDKSNNDIRKYITVTGASTSKTNRPILNSLTNSSKKSGNIAGFTNLQSGATKNAGSNTYVITKKGSRTTSSSSAEPPIQPFAGVGRSLSTSSLPSQDYATVREHWLKKFDNNKRGNTTTERHSKKAVVECPVCNRPVDSETFNKHLDQCLENPKKDTKDCIICATPIPSVDYESHVNQHFEKCDDQSEDTKTPCLACGKQIVKTELSSHLEDCMSMSNVFDSIQMEVGEVEGLNRTYNCPFCLQLIEEGGMQEHIDACLKSSDVVDLLSNADSDFDD